MCLIQTIFIPPRVYSNDAASTNKGYRAASICIELRDTGQYGFLLPADQVRATGTII